jgi:hypothetical protein
VDVLPYNSARTYGPLRLPALLSRDNWEYLGTVHKVPS